MISKEIIKEGLQKGIIRLTEDPNLGGGTVAAIGDNWFYFGGLTAEEESPEEYREHVPMDDIVDEIYSVINEFRFENKDEYEYYAMYLGEALGENRHWSEIHCDYLCDIDNFWRVDAWKTDNDAEEGEVIAYIDDITKRVLYVNPLARVDSLAQEVIQKKLEEINPSLTVEKKNGTVSVCMGTAIGTLVAEFEDKETMGAEDDAVYIGLKASDDPYLYVDLLGVRADKDEVRLYTYDDIWNEDWQRKSVITKEEIDRVIESEK